MVIASAAITVWTRAALGFVLGPKLTAVCVWIAVDGSVRAVIMLAPSRTRPSRSSLWGARSLHARELQRWAVASCTA